ncbi:hypothetical protein DPMN_145840 [Dreissena polymorpha]|uniref:Uncharacterized protein n=2 Tax=Dreissena polymorpha TaxID=45954 RepID=A0A9D4F6U6_DREPO|nr:hypothetical protein DPMN_145840 [Dreissena polymorpha]
MWSSFKVADRSCILTKARSIGNDLRHSSKGNVTDDVLKEFVSTLINLLNEPACAAGNVDAKTTADKLKELLENNNTPSEEEMKDLDERIKNEVANDPGEAVLSSCAALKNLKLENYTLQPMALCNYHKLCSLNLLDCNCNGLILSACVLLEFIDIKGLFKFAQNTFHNLKNLTCLKLCTFVSDSLDVSLCHSLRELELRGSLILIPGYLGNLTSLERLVLYCTCIDLDVTLCSNLKDIEIIGSLTLLTTSMKIFTELRSLKLGCNCESLDLSCCHNLELLELDEKVTLSSNTFCELRNLKHLSVKCNCSILNLSLFPKLETLLMKSPVCVLQTSILGSEKLKQLSLESYEFDKSDNILSVLNNSDPNSNRLPPSVSDIKLTDIGCSWVWLRYLLCSLSHFKHEVKVFLHARYIQIDQSPEHVVNNTVERSNVRLTCPVDCIGLYKALEGFTLLSLNLMTIQHGELLKNANIEDLIMPITPSL